MKFLTPWMILYLYLDVKGEGFLSPSLYFHLSFINLLKEILNNVQMPVRGYHVNIGSMKEHPLMGYRDTCRNILRKYQ